MRPAKVIRGKTLREWSKALGVKLGCVRMWDNKGTLVSRIDGTWKPQRIKRRVRGKSVREWSQILGVKLVTAWSWFKNKTLEAHIDGTHVNKLPKRVCGMTYKEIADKCGVTKTTVGVWAHRGLVEKRLRGEYDENQGKPAKPIFQGLKWNEIAERLGNGKPLSRQRVFQLLHREQLEARLAGVDLVKAGNEKRKAATKERCLKILADRKPGESLVQLARRAGVCPAVLRRHAGERVPFAAERKSQDKQIASQRRPGESVAQLAKRLGMKSDTVRRACGGKVPFAKERRLIAAQKVVAEAAVVPAE